MPDQPIPLPARGSRGGGGRRSYRRTRHAATAASALAAALTLVAYASAGLGGVFLAVTGIVVIGALLLLLLAPEAPVLPRRTRHPPMTTSAYRNYDRVARNLSWGTVSPRHYDTVTRPMLQRILRARLGEGAEGDAGRQLLGSDLWPYLDPSRPVDRSSERPGIDMVTLSRIIQRLEDR